LPEMTAILTTYNRDALVGMVLKSFVSQTFANDAYELIVVDDGSLDDTAAVVSHFVDKIPLRYVYQPNAGLAAAKNHGLALARAAVVLFIDDDDILAPDCLQQHAAMHRLYPGQEIAVLGYTKLDTAIANDPLMHFVTEVGGYLFSYSRAQEDCDLGYDWFWGGRTSFKRAFALESGGFNPIFRFGCEDIELGYRLAKRGLKVRYAPAAVSVMLRRIPFDAFCNRLRRQGNSQYVFSRLWREPEAQRWCEVEDFQKEWPSIAPTFDTLMLRARALDDWARTSFEVDLPLEPQVKDLLYDSYYRAFRACKLAGIAETQSRWQDAV
jgi:glycosyltransferase involved in cell wall biosynthesis